MLPDLTPEMLETHEGTEFLLTTQDGRVIALELVEIQRLTPQAGAPRAEPFAIVFVGPADPMLGQGPYGLDHASMGQLEIFLVPIGRDAAGRVRYEAVFN